MLSRRQILKAAAATAAVMATPLSAWPAPERGRVVVAREADRARAVAACLDALEFRACEGRGVAVKANFNSEDAFPASTHPDTLAAPVAAPARHDRGGESDVATNPQRDGRARGVR